MRRFERAFRGGIGHVCRGTLLAAWLLGTTVGAQAGTSHLDSLTAAKRRYLLSRVFFVPTDRAQRGALPVSVTNTVYLPAVTSQGQLGTCGAYGITYYLKTYQEAREHGWTQPDPAVNPERCASPAFTYKLLRHGPQSGARPLVVAQNMVDFGVCSWATLPYDDTMDTFPWPDASTWRAAMPWRAQAAGLIPRLGQADGRRTLKAHLASGDLATISMIASRNLHGYPGGEDSDATHISNDVIYKCDTDGSGIYHALTILGYDDTREYLDEDTGELRQGAFLAVNSWGTGWGVTEPSVGTRGFCWLAYQLFENGGALSDAVVMRDRIGHTPAFALELGIDHDESELFGTLSTSGRGDHSVALFPGLHMDNPKHTHQSIWIDVSDMIDYGRAGVTLQVRDFSDNPGTLDPFTVESWDGISALASASVPATTVNFMDSQESTDLYVGRYQRRRELAAADDLRNGGAAWADADGDGDPDLLVAGYFGGTTPAWKTLLLRNDGESGFAGIAYDMITGDSVAWTDIDNDGDADAIVSASDRIIDSANQTVVYHNDGGATFTALAQTFPAANAGALAVGDFDNDGDVDLCIGNDDETVVWLNQGGGSFAKRAAGLPALGAYADGYAIRAGDLDGDHRLDLVLSGIGEQGATRAYLNQGVPLLFSAAPDTLPEERFPALALADVDLDGDLDLAMSGCWGDRQMRLFRNDGAGGFTATDASLPQLRAGNLAWADVNADGRPDLLATGREEEVWGAYPDRYYKNDTLVLTQNADGDFEQFGPPLPDLSRGVANFADVDGDDNPDILVGGTLAQIYEAASDKLTLGVYLHGDTVPGWIDGNAPPTAPTDDLQAVHDGHGRVTFTWSGAADAETPETGLRYQLRCGTTSGGDEVFSGALRPGTPAAHQRSGHFLDHIPEGTLHWQVRTVDTAGAVSPWSVEQEFAVGTYTHRQYLATNVNAEFAGAVDPAPGTTAHDRGDVVSLTATPAPGYAFSEWQGDIDGVADPAAADTTVTLDVDRQLTAVFKRIADPARPAWALAADGVFDSYATQQHTLESFDGYLLRMGGQTSTWALQNLVYASDDDGQTWRQLWQVAWNDHGINFSVPWPARAAHCSEVFDGKLWVFAGEGTEHFLAEVWRASDIFTWERVTDAAPWGRRINTGSAVFDGKLWILGGEKFAGGGNPPDRFSDVWSSADGENWTQVTDSAPWPAGTVQATPFNDSLIVLARGQVWQSTDGENWNALTLDAPFGQLLDTCLEAFNGELVVVGGYDNNTWQRSDQTWTSPDGINWSEIAPDPDSHWSARNHAASCVEGDRLWLVGGKQADGDLADDAWYLEAGELPADMGRLRLFVEPLVGGSIDPPGNTSYVDDLGTVFSLVANPAIGYAFDHWEGPVADADSTETTVTLERDTEVTAHFTTTDTALTITFQPDIRVGSVSVSPGTSDWEWDWETDTITYMHPRGTELTVQATPKFGYVFDHWEGDLSGTSGTAELVLDEPRNITAVFVEDPILPTGTLACIETWAAVIKADGTAWAVGRNAGSQQGHTLTPDDPGEFWPVAIASNVRQIFLAETGGLGITTGGDLVGWGPAWASLADYDLGAHPILTTLNSGIRGCSGLLALSDEQRNPLFFDRYGTLFDTTNQTVELGFDGEFADVVALAEGPNTVFAVTRDGQLYGWGENVCGQLGVGDTLPAHQTPQRVEAPCGVRRIACGLDPMHPFTLALLGDQTVASWGDNTRGQLARTPDGANPAIEPGPIAGLTGIVKIAAGSGHGLALDQNGDLYAWGDNTFGQLGTGNFDDAAAPVQVSADIADLAAGPNYTLVRRENGAFAWTGQVPGEDEALTTLTNIPGLAYDDPSLVLTTSVDPAGVGQFFPHTGQSRIASGRPIPLHAEDTDRFEFAHWSDTAADPFAADTTLTTSESCTLRSHYRYADGALAELSVEPSVGGHVEPESGTHEYEPGTVVTLRAVADAEYRFQRWHGGVSDPQSRTTTVVLDQDQRVQASFAPRRFEPKPQIAVGRDNAMEYDALVLYSDSRVSDYGATASGSFIRLNGEGDSLTNVLALAVGEGHQLALSMDGSVWGWGDNAYGQCGTGDLGTTRYVFPQKVVGPDGEILRGISRIAAGPNFSLALDPSGFLYSWGQNTEAQLGHSDEYAVVPAATPVVNAAGAALTEVRAIAAGDGFAVVATVDGSVLAWGRNDAGQLGLAGRRGEPVPQQVPNVGSAAEVAAGGACAGAVTAAGEVWTWGDNTYGQLGRGTTGGSGAPARVSDLPVITDLAVGKDHMLALAKDGTVWAWGRGEMGRLGNGFTTSSNTPVQVINASGDQPLTDIRAVACHEHSYAVTESGRLLQWGYDNASFGDPEPVTRPLDRLGLGRPVGDGLCGLSLTSFPETGGFVQPNEGLVFVNRGTLVDIRARPAAGYRFLGWAGDLSGDLSSTTVRVSDDLAAVACFELADPLLRLGSLRMTPDRTGHLHLFLEGQTAALEGVQIELAAPDGFSFGPATYGLNNGPNSELSYAVPSPRRALAVLADTDDEASLKANGVEPLMTFQLNSDPGCLPDTYRIRFERRAGSTPVVAYGNGHLWQMAACEDGVVTVEPEQELVLRLTAAPLASQADSADAGPTPPTCLRSDREYDLELWLQDRRDNGSPAVSAQLDLVLPADLVPLRTVRPETAESVSGTISGATVTQFGAVFAAGTLASEDWVCVARLRVQPVAEGSMNVVFSNAAITLENTARLSEPAIAVQPGDTLTVAHCANSAPGVGPVAPASGRWGGQITGNVAGTDDNPDDVLAYALVSGPNHGELIAFDSDTGAFTYQPDVAYSGPDSFAFTVSDGTLASATAEQVLLVSRGWCANVRRNGEWCAFGQDDDAADGSDPLDLPTGDGWSLAFEGGDGRGLLQRDVRGRSGNGSPVWRLRVAPVAQESELSWDSLSVPDGLHLVQIVPDSDSLVLADMREDDRIALAADTGYVFDMGIVRNYVMQLDAGWNLTAFPGVPLHGDIATLFADHPDGARIQLYGWTDDRYYAPSSCAAYKGYWIYSAAGAIHDIPLAPVFTPELHLKKGWNLVGVPFPSDPPQHPAVARVIWRFQDGRYQRAFRLLPGTAYWIFAFVDATITLEDEGGG